LIIKHGSLIIDNRRNIREKARKFIVAGFSLFDERS